MLARIVSSSEEPDDPGDQNQHIVEFWNCLRNSDDTGSTTWEVLEPLEREVTESLYGLERDVGRAESLTAHALLLIAGCRGT